MNKEETLAGNKLIAEFMGYIYYHAGVDVDDSDCGGCYERKPVFSKVPIEVNDYDDQIYFKELPNPDYNNKESKRWNSDIELLSWGTLNFGEYTHELKYDTDWNELMAVVDKIENMKDTFDKGSHFRVVISERTCGIYFYKSGGQSVPSQTDKFYKNGKNKLVTTWLTIVEFIKWYNHQNKK